MRERKLVSIILPTYNGKRYIRQTIESCLKQTYTHFELIVIDDHSTDGTELIVKEFAAKDDRVRYYRNEINRKLPASLNIGFEKAKGAYYTWTSDDNLYAEDAIGEMVDALNENEAYSLVYSSYKMINDRGEIIDQYRAIPETLLFGCAVGACFLYKKEVHETLKGYDEQKFRMEDYDFWLRACLQFRFLFIDKPDLYYYRKHNDNLSTKIYSEEELLKKYKADYAITLAQFFQQGIAPDFTTEDIANHIDIFFNTLIQQRNYTDKTAGRFQKLSDHFGKLRSISWEKTNFDPEQVVKVIDAREKEMTTGLINTLLFENLQLKGKNPRIASQLEKPIFWYYREYEALPSWYKKLGHVLKILQGNRPIQKSNN